MKRPWNIVNQPVYSLATYSENSFNMNICTYVTAVSMKPKLYAIAIYAGTKTLHNVINTDYAVLQLLSASQLNLVKPLGKKSGNNYNKVAYLNKKKLLTTWDNHAVLKDSAALIHLQKLSSINTGDHTTFLFKASKYKVWQDEHILMFQDLVNAGIIL